MIRRGKHTTNYTVIPNCVFESGLSAEAVGILCYLVGRPENWKINSTEVARRFACGVQRVQRVLRELETAKYAKREQGGKGGGFNWVVYDTVQNGELEPPILAKKRESQKAIIENSVNRVLRAIESTDSLPSTDSLESTEEPKGSLSGKGPTTQSAKKILDYLNEKSGHRYQPVKANLDKIKARLREYDEQTLLGVVDCKVHEWLRDDKMREFLRPATLFGAEKCAQYVGQAQQSKRQRGDW